MNRLAPLIDRAPPRSGPARSWAIPPLEEAAATISGALRLFLTAFVGGVVFFGTYLF